MTAPLSCFDVVYREAAELRQRFQSHGSAVSFTLVPVQVSPQALLSMLADSVVADLLLPEGSLLNDVSSPSYVPISPVHARALEATGVGITASTWSPPSWDFDAGELIIRVVFGMEVKAAEELTLYAAKDRPPRLSRSIFDHQRAETGYEGERRVTLEPTVEDAQSFVGLVRQIVPPAG